MMVFVLDSCRAAKSVLMHRKVSIKRFNAPAGDTFQAISLAGGHVISINSRRGDTRQIFLYVAGISTAEICHLNGTN